MILFRATYDSGTEIDIKDSNGSVLTMIDHSEYAGETGIAADASGVTLVLPSTAEGNTTTYYDGKIITITAGTGVGSYAIVGTGGNYNTGTYTISAISWSGTSPTTGSTYSITEQGHAQTDFSDVRKVRITLPDDTTYLLSTLGDGDASTVVPNGQTLPITDLYTYDQGDGVYSVKLSVLPTYNVLANYSVGMCVYYSGSFYICILASAAGTLPTNTT